MGAMKFLLTADDLMPRLDEFVIVDARRRDEYETAHVEGAVYLPGDPLLKDGVGFISPGNFGVLMDRLGVRAGSKIIVYDDGNGRPACRFWFVAKHYGHKDVFVLDGGWPAAASLPHSTVEARPAAGAAGYTPYVTEGYMYFAQNIADNFERIKLLDVRTWDEYCGHTLVDNPRGGHIPGSIHINHAEFLSPTREGYFKTAEEITRIMDNAGIGKEDFIVPY